MSIKQQNRPLCKCHNLPKAKKGKNSWRCRIKQRQRSVKYDKSIKGYLRKRKYVLKIERENIIKQLEELENVK